MRKKLSRKMKYLEGARRPKEQARWCHCELDRWIGPISDAAMPNAMFSRLELCW